jgi:hypothetical protein
MLQVEVTNHYPFPVELYDASNTFYRPDLLGTIAQSKTALVSVAARPEGSVYHFSVRRKHGRTIKEIREPSTVLNSSETLTLGN